MSMCFCSKALQLTCHSSRWRQLKTLWDCRFFNDFFLDDTREHIPLFFGVLPSPVWCTGSFWGLATMRISRFLGGMCHVWRHWSGDSACEELVAQTIDIAGTTLWPKETYTRMACVWMCLSRIDMHIAVVMLNIHYLLSDMHILHHDAIHNMFNIYIYIICTYVCIHLYMYILIINDITLFTYKIHTNNKYYTSIFR